MGAQYFRDSRGRYHYVLMQEFTTSCGPACVAMVEGLYFQICRENGEGRARELSQNYPGRWTLAGGTDAMMNLSYVLNAEGIRAYGATNVTPEGVWNYLRFYAKESTPVIVRVGWSGGGGHFVVCPFVDPDGRAFFRDPWYGLHEVARSDMPNYSPSGASGQLSGHVVVTYR